MTSVCHLHLKHYTHFLRQEVACVLPPALHRSYHKQFDADHFCEKPNKFLVIQFVCKLTFKDFWGSFQSFVGRVMK